MKGLELPKTCSKCGSEYTIHETTPCGDIIVRCDCPEEQKRTLAAKAKTLRNWNISELATYFPVNRPGNCTAKALNEKLVRLEDAQQEVEKLRGLIVKKDKRYSDLWYRQAEARQLLSEVPDRQSKEFSFGYNGLQAWREAMYHWIKKLRGAVGNVKEYVGPETLEEALEEEKKFLAWCKEQRENKEEP